MTVDLAATDRLWREGKRKETIDRLLRAINQHPGPRPPLEVAIRFCYYLFLLGDLAACEKFLRELLKYYPNEPRVQENLANVLVRRRPDDWSETIALLERVVEKTPLSANTWDGLAHACGEAGQTERARHAGERALLLKDDACDSHINAVPTPAATPQQFDQDASGVDVVAFSLWGDHPRYLRGALRNALLIGDLLPGWQCRFYVESSTPSGLLSLLEELGASVLRQPQEERLRLKLGWRFQVANDPSVRRFLVRDCDSVISAREVEAVNAWLASDKFFHVMRDWWTHTDLILAGLWGGRAGLLPDLSDALGKYQPPAMETPNVDQWFLRDYVWPRIRSTCLVHDRCYRCFDAIEWSPEERFGSRHVGQNEYAAERDYQDQVLKPWLKQYPWLGLPKQ